MLTRTVVSQPQRGLLSHSKGGTVTPKHTHRCPCFEDALPDVPCFAPYPRPNPASCISQAHFALQLWVQFGPWEALAADWEIPGPCSSSLLAPAVSLAAIPPPIGELLPLWSQRLLGGFSNTHRLPLMLSPSGNGCVA